MVKIKNILKYWRVIIFFVIIMSEITLLVIFKMLFFTTEIEFYELLVELFKNFIILTSVATALVIPFIMKNIEKMKEEAELRDRIETIINEIKKYFEIIISSKFDALPKKNLYIPPQFQFFKSIAKRKPEFLSKLGIDFSKYTSTSSKGTQFDLGTLILLNIYRLRGGNQPTLVYISTDNEVSELPNNYENILKKIIENAERKFSITLDKNLYLLSDDLKSGYREINKL